MKKNISFNILLVLCFLVSACSNENAMKQNEKQKGIEQRPYYISFTVTREEKDKLNMYNYTYDLETKKIENKAKLTYNAQYPLTAYSDYDNAVYYSGRDKAGCDQLHKLDLNTMKDERLSDDIFAINYIIPMQDKIYLGAVLKGERPIGLFIYENREKKRIVLDKDLMVWKLSVQPQLHNLAFNTYSQSELDNNMEKDKMGEDDSGIGINTVWKYNYKNDKLEEVSTTKTGYMTKLGLDYNNNIYFQIRGEWNLVQNDKIALNGNLDELNIDEIVYMDEKDIFYTDTDYSLVQYHRKDKKKTIIYHVKEAKAALNNAVILEKRIK